MYILQLLFFMTATFGIHGTNWSDTPATADDWTGTYEGPMKSSRVFFFPNVSQQRATLPSPVSPYLRQKNDDQLLRFEHVDPLKKFYWLALKGLWRQLLATALPSHDRIKSYTHDGLNCLHCAASFADERITKEILAAGIDPNSFDEGSHEAQRCSREKQILEASIAKIESKIARLGTGSHEVEKGMLLENSQKEEMEELRGELDRLHKILCYKKTHVGDIKNVSALMYAAMHGNTAMTKVLLQHNADPNMVNSEGYNALMYAIKNYYAYKKKSKAPHIFKRKNPKARHIANYKGVVDLLAPVTDLDQLDGCGDTVLHSAIDCKKLSAVEQLVHHGAKPVIANSSGYTAADKIDFIKNVNYKTALRALLQK